MKILVERERERKRERERERERERMKILVVFNGNFFYAYLLTPFRKKKEERKGRKKE